jgi:hypothetical protein
MSKKTAAKKVEDAAIKADLEKQMELGTEAQLKKLELSKEHMVAQLASASKKYLTINGYLAARKAFEQVLFDYDMGLDQLVDLSRQIALSMSKLTSELASTIEAADPMELTESVLDGLLADEFVSTWNGSYADAAMQLLVVELLQNIGPNIQEHIQFREGTTAELENVATELAKYEESAPKIKLVK